MTTGIVLIGDGKALSGILRALNELHLSQLPILALDDMALPLLEELLCEKYHFKKNVRKKCYVKPWIKLPKRLRLLCYLFRKQADTPLKEGPLLFYFSDSGRIICAPSSDLFLKNGKILCKTDAQLLWNLMKASVKRKNKKELPAWILTAAGAQRVLLIQSGLKEEKTKDSCFFVPNHSELAYEKLMKEQKSLYQAIFF